jgi:hypothetical protein
MYRHFLLNHGYAEEESLASVFLSKLESAKTIAIAEQVKRYILNEKSVSRNR